VEVAENKLVSIVIPIECMIFVSLLHKLELILHNFFYRAHFCFFEIFDKMIN
jgi:hypothetical protein